MNKDWLEISVSNPTSSLSDLYQMGIDPSDVSLQSADKYKENKQVQEVFKGVNGEFDSSAFDAYYDSAVQSLNAFKADDYNFNAISQDVYWESPYSKGKKEAKNRVRVSSTEDDPWANLSLEQGAGFGTLKINKWSEPKKSEAEVAQGLEVIDGDTKEGLGFTPEDTGLSNGFGFFREPIVRATYNEDVLNDSGEVIHKKGELYYDENGLPRYETLKNRQIAGKQILSAWDTLTREDSFFNKFDFMDNDGLDKSMIGAITQAAVTVAPMAIAAYASGGSSLGAQAAATAGNLYTASYIVRNILDAGGSLVNTINSALGKPIGDLKEVNNLQGFMRSWSTGQSEYAKNNFFSAENMLQLAADSVFQLKSQRAIAELPTQIKAFQAYKLSGGKFNTVKDTLIKSGVSQSEAARMTQQIIFNANKGAFENSARIGSYLGTAYMTITSSTDIVDSAKMLGIDDKDAAIMHLALMGVLGPLFRYDLGDRLTSGMDLTSYKKLQERAIAGKAKKYAAVYGKNAPVGTTQEATKKSFFDKLKGIYKFANDTASQIDSDMRMGKVMTSEILRSSFGEGAEEISEYGMQKGVEGLYNLFNSLGYTKTEKGTRYEYDAKQIAAELLATAVGGAVGGAVFKGIDYKNIKASISDNRDFTKLTLQGHGKALKDQVRAMESKGLLPGDKTLSASLYTPTTGDVNTSIYAAGDESNNQQKAIADKLIQEIDVLEGMMESLGIDPINTAIDKIDGFYENLVNTGVDTDIITTLDESLSDIAKIYSDIKQIEQERTKTGKLTPEQDSKLQALNDDLAEATEEYKRITSPEATFEYLRQGLFNQDESINDAFKVITKDKIVKDTTEYLSYSQLEAAASSGDSQAKDDLANVTKQYDEYTGKKDGVVSRKYRDDLRNARREFEGMNDQMASRLPEFDEYIKSIESLKGYISEISDTSDSVIEKYFQPGADDLSNMESLKNIIRMRDGFINDLKSLKNATDGATYIPEYLINNVDRTLSKLQASFESMITSKNVGSIRTNAYDKAKALLSANTEVLNLISDDAKLAAQRIVALESDPDFGKLDAGVQIAEFLDLLSIITNSAKSIDLKNIIQLKQDSEAEANGEYNRILSLPDADAIIELAKYITDNNDLGDILNYQDYIGFTPEDLSGDIIKILRSSDPENEELVTGETYGDHLDNDGAEFTDDLIVDSIANELFAQKLKATGSTLNKYDANFLLNLSKIKGIESEAINADEIIEGISSSITTYKSALEILNDIKDTTTKKTSSPLSDILAPFYNFLNSTENTILTMGPEEFANQNPDFVKQLDDTFGDLNKIQALIIATYRINPLVNKFAETHQDILSDAEKSKRFVDLGDSSNASYLLDEVNSLAYRFDYIKSLNEYNLGNTTKKLIKESKVITKLKAKALTSKFSDSEVLKVLRAYPELKQLLDVAESITSSTYPSMFGIKDIDDNNNISDDINNKAIEELVFAESKIFEAAFDVLNNDGKARDELFNVLFSEDFDDMDYLKKVSLESKAFNPYNTILYMHRILSVSSADMMSQLIYKGGKVFIGFENSRFAPLQNQMDAAFDIYATAYGNYWLDTKLSETIASKMPTPKAAFITNSVVYVQGPPGSGKTSATISLGTELVLNKAENMEALALAPEDSQLDVLLTELADSGESRVSKNSATVERFINSLTKGGDLYSKILAIGTPKLPVGKKIEDLTDSELQSVRSAAEKNLTDAVAIKDSIKNLLISEGVILDPKTASSSVEAIFSKIKLAILDEVTYNDNRILEALNQIKDAINGGRTRTKKLAFAYAGDNMQMGNTPPELGVKYNVNHQAVLNTQRLTAAIRSKYDLVNETLAQIQEAEESTSAKRAEGGGVAHTSALSSIKYAMRSTIHPTDGLVGFKAIDKNKLDISDITPIIESLKARPDNTLLYVVQNESDKKAIYDSLNAEGLDMSKIKILTPRQAQSTQANYVVIDAKPITNGTAYDNLRVLEFYNTMLSRAKNYGVVADNKINIINFNNIDAKQAQIQNKFTDKVIDRFKAIKNEELKFADKAITNVGKTPDLDTGLAPMPPKPSVKTPLELELELIDGMLNGYDKVLKSIDTVDDQISKASPRDTVEVARINSLLDKAISDIKALKSNANSLTLKEKSAIDKNNSLITLLDSSIMYSEQKKNELNTKVKDALAIDMTIDAARNVYNTAKVAFDNVAIIDESINEIESTRKKLVKILEDLNKIDTDALKLLTSDQFVTEIDVLKDVINEKLEDLRIKEELLNKGENNEENELDDDIDEFINNVEPPASPELPKPTPGNPSGSRFVRQNIKYINLPYILESDILQLVTSEGIERDSAVALYKQLQAIATKGANNTGSDVESVMYYLEKSDMPSNSVDISNRYARLDGKKLLRIKAVIKLSNSKTYDVAIATNALRSGDVFYNYDAAVGKYNSENGKSQLFTYDDLFGSKIDGTGNTYKLFNIRPHGLETAQPDNFKTANIEDLRREFPFWFISTPKIFTISKYHQPGDSWDSDRKVIFEKLKRDFSGKAFSWAISDQGIQAAYKAGYLTDEDMLNIYLSISEGQLKEQSIDSFFTFNIRGQEYTVPPFSIRPLMIAEYSRNFSMFASELKDLINSIVTTQNGSVESKSIQSKINESASPFVKMGIVRLLYEVHKAINADGAILPVSLSSNFTERITLKLTEEQLKHIMFTGENRGIAGTYDEYVANGSTVLDVLKSELNKLFTTSNILENVLKAENDNELDIDPEDTGRNLQVRLTALFPLINSSVLCDAITSIIEDASVNIRNYNEDGVYLYEKVNSIFKNGKIDKNFTFQKSKGDNRMIKDVYISTGTPIIYKYKEITPPVVYQMSTFQAWNIKGEKQNVSSSFDYIGLVNEYNSIISNIKPGEINDTAALESFLSRLHGIMDEDPRIKQVLDDVINRIKAIKDANIKLEYTELERGVEAFNNTFNNAIISNNFSEDEYAAYDLINELKSKGYDILARSVELKLKEYQDKKVVFEGENKAISDLMDLIDSLEVLKPREVVAKYDEIIKSSVYDKLPKESKNKLKKIKEDADKKIKTEIDSEVELFKNAESALKDVISKLNDAINNAESSLELLRSSDDLSGIKSTINNSEVLTLLSGFLNNSEHIKSIDDVLGNSDQKIEALNLLKNRLITISSEYEQEFIARSKQLKDKAEIKAIYNILDELAVKYSGEFTSNELINDIKQLEILMSTNLPVEVKVDIEEMISELSEKLNSSEETGSELIGSLIQLLNANEELTSQISELFGEIDTQLSQEVRLRNDETDSKLYLLIDAIEQLKDKRSAEMAIKQITDYLIKNCY